MSLRKCHVKFVQYVNIITSIAAGSPGGAGGRFMALTTMDTSRGCLSASICGLDTCFSLYIIVLTPMKRSKPDRNRDPKTEALREQGALHPNPESVEDETFRRDEFFDARDRVQVRYEMLRRHRVDREAVTDVAGL